MKRPTQLDQYEIDELFAHLSRLEQRAVEDQLEYFDHLMREKPMMIDARAPNCSVEYLSIIGKGETPNAAALNWIANAREWRGHFESKRQVA